MSSLCESSGPLSFPAPSCLMLDCCRWFTNLAAAGDAVGTPLCASLAIINEATGEVEQRDFHTGAEEGA